MLFCSIKIVVKISKSGHISGLAKPTDETELASYNACKCIGEKYLGLGGYSKPGDSPQAEKMWFKNRPYSKQRTIDRDAAQEEKDLHENNYMSVMFKGERLMLTHGEKGSFKCPARAALSPMLAEDPW